jgi:hypothetical protein
MARIEMASAATSKDSPFPKQEGDCLSHSRPNALPTRQQPSPQTHRVVQLSRLGRELELAATTEEICSLRSDRIHD